MTDVAEMKPAKSGKAKAQPKLGAMGAALAIVFLREAEAQGQAEAKKGESLKSRLLKVVTLPERVDHLEFRGALKARRDEIKAQAEAADMPFTHFLEQDRVSYFVNTQISMWSKFSEAVEAGWKPTAKEVEKTPFWTLSALATARLSAKANSGKPDGTKAEGGTKVAGPTKLKAGRKAKSIKAKVQELMTAVGAAIPIGSKEPPKDRNLAEMVGVMIAGATVAELAAVQLRIDAEVKLAKGREAAAAIADKTIKAARKGGRVMATAPGRLLGDKPGVSGEVKETATARK